MIIKDLFKITLLVVVLCIIVVYCRPRADNTENPNLLALQKTWQAFLLAMQSGDEESIKLVTTERGFESLKRFISYEEREDILKSWGEAWAELEIRWIKVSDNYAEANLGPVVKEHRLEFVNTKDGWRLDMWFPGE